MANFPPRAGSGNQSSSQSSNQVGGQPGSGAAPPSSPATGAVTGLRTAGVRPCPGCGTLVSVHATVCPNCGEQIAAKEKMVRCRRCRHRASSNLVLCPHCGRELQPAPSRWLTWGLPLLVLLMLGGFLILRGGLNDPSSWAQAQVARVVRLVQSLGGRLQPDVTISMIPAGQDPNDPLVSQAAQAGVALSAAAPAATEAVDVANAAGVVSPAESTGPGPEATEAPAELAVEPTSTQVPTEVPATPTELPPTATASLVPTNTSTNTPAATSTTAATQTPATAKALATASGTAAAATLKETLTVAQTLTRTNAAIANTTSNSTTLASTSALTRTTAAAAVSQALTQTVALLGLPTPTPLSIAPTATPVPVVTATPAPLAVYEVRRGDTLFEIAGQYDVAVEDLLAANGLTENDVYTIQPGDELKIPAPTPEGAPTAALAAGESATATPAPETYTVRAGDTILAIALRNNVSVEDMLAANGMSINDARTLQPGDDLIIPGPEGIATATPTTTPTGAATDTPAATPTGTPTNAPSPTPAPASIVRVDAPRLRSPENGTAVSCSGQETLTWLQVPSVRSTDLYLVHLGYVNSVAADGKEDVVWVISQQRPVSATSWQLDNNLCGLAPNTAGKQWRWYVEVAEPGADGLRPVSPASPVWGFAWQ